jgi:hypothetical protein
MASLAIEQQEDQNNGNEKKGDIIIEDNSNDNKIDFVDRNNTALNSLKPPPSPPPPPSNLEPEFKGYLLEPEPYDDSDEDADTKSHANYFDWKLHFPEIAELVKNVDIVREEMRALKDWRPWPETNLYSARKEWNVFPFLHTFPATDESKITWVPHFCHQCPKTTAMLKKIRGIRTALLSRMGPGTVLAAHRGWADLSNHVLRLHLALEVPEGNACGLWVRGEKQFHKEGEVLCFDDSKLHKAFNLSDKQRTVLIFDIVRPDSLPLGTAKKGHTDQLDDFIAWFQ